ncbi:hypothetical protein MKW92_032038 [Papaver armeniacum]|nr:hypothetical protein MKW92_032038 [Papaver armeniacum]
MPSCGYLDHDTLCSDSSEPLYKKSVHITFPVEHKKKKIVGSCNGLVCYVSANGGLGPCKEEDISIFNPFTRDCKKIPIPPSQPGDSLCKYGFGYDLKTDDYKIALYHYQFGMYDPRIHIYSSKLNSWKTVNIPFKIPDHMVFFNGLFHWVNGQYISGPKEMRCFDTANDTVKHFPLPRRKFRYAQVCVLGGFLCVTGWDDNNIGEVWIMKEYGVSESWTKMFTIRGIHKGELLGLQHLDMKQSFKNYATLLYHDNCSTYSYDLNHQVAKQVQIDGKIIPAYTKYTFFGSLVSPSLY